MSDEDLRELRRAHEADRDWTSFVRWATAAARSGAPEALELVRATRRHALLLVRRDRLRAAWPGADRDVGHGNGRGWQALEEARRHQTNLERRARRLLVSLEIRGLAPIGDAPKLVRRARAERAERFLDRRVRLDERAGAPGPLCACGHSLDEHEDDLDVRACAVDPCPCRAYAPIRVVVLCGDPAPDELRAPIGTACVLHDGHAGSHRSGGIPEISGEASWNRGTGLAVVSTDDEGRRFRASRPPERP